MNTFPGSCLTIFLVPESQEQMVDHIKNRGEMTEGAFQTRLKSAEFELSKRDLFQNQIVNKEGKLSETIEKIAQIIEPAMKSA
jgi:guanylate kinase